MHDGAILPALAFPFTTPPAPSFSFKLCYFMVKLLISFDHKLVYNWVNFFIGEGEGEMEKMMR